MCKPKTPKIEQPKEKPLNILHNPYLDGTYDRLRIGRSAMRTDIPRETYGSPAGAGVVTPSVGTPPAGVSNPLTIGGGGCGRFRGRVARV